MDVIAVTIPDEETPRARLALLLKHFSKLDDDREPWRVMYPLAEVLLLVTCATIASCDDFDDHRRVGQTPSRLSAALFVIPLQHPLRALGACPRQPDRPGLVRPLFQRLDCGAVAGPARVHRHRRQNVAPNP